MKLPRIFLFLLFLSSTSFAQEVVTEPVRVCVISQIHQPIRVLIPLVSGNDTAVHVPSQAYEHYVGMHPIDKSRYIEIHTNAGQTVICTSTPPLTKEITVDVIHAVDGTLHCTILRGVQC